jgi:hypothetical protein
MTMSQDDMAVNSALDLLNETICECGHLKTEHNLISPKDVGSCAECPCLMFDPVSFLVMRADQQVS